MNFEKWIFPVIGTLPASNLLDDLVSVQPMTEVEVDSNLIFKLVKAKPDRPRHTKWTPVSFKDSACIKSIHGHETFITWEDLQFKWDGTVQELEDDLMAEVLYRCNDQPTPVINKARENFTAWAKDFQTGDVIYEFSTSGASWAQLAGRAGYVVMRGQTIIALKITQLS